METFKITCKSKTKTISFESNEKCSLYKKITKLVHFLTNNNYNSGWFVIDNLDNKQINFIKNLINNKIKRLHYKNINNQLYLKFK